MAIEEGIKVKFDGDSSGLEAAAKRASTTLGNFKRSTGDATYALSNLSRVAQDAPYGFMGIANNLNPLVESFQRLKVETGSTRTAFASMAKGLIGPAGIGMAIGVASSLLVTFGDELMDIVRAANKARISLKDIFADAAKSAGDDIVKLEVFQKKLNDLSLAAADRVRIAKEYNKVADQTNQLDLTQINNLTLINEKIEAQNKLIQQRALTTAALSKLTEASSKLIDNELKLQVALQASSLSYDQVAKAADELFRKEMSSVGSVREGLDGLNAANKPLMMDGGGISKVSKALISLFNDVKKGRYEFDKLTDSLKNFITVEGLTTRDPIKIKAQAEVVSIVTPLVGSKTLTVPVVAVPQMPKPGQVKLGGFGDVQFKTPDASERQKAFETLNAEMLKTAELTNNLLTPAFQNLFSSIVAGENPIKAFFSSLGQSIQQLIQQLIAAAIQALILSAIFPGGAMIGGSMRKGFGSMFSGVMGFANGGIIYGPTLGLMGEYAGARNNPEVVAPLNKLKSIMQGSGGSGMQDGQIVSKVSGADILLVYNRTQRKQGRGG